MADAKQKREKIPRQHMPEQDPKLRITNFNQVNFGYTEEMAVKEAKRCLQCKKPKCVAGCPVGIDIPAFIQLIAEGNFIGAARKLKEKNVLPAICGRVCPQEEQCETPCILTKMKEEPVAIGHLERFAADYERESDAIIIPDMPKPTGVKIAIVGSGPSGLTVAGEMAQLGHSVTMFEALHKPGGVLVYGIPEFRLPKAILASEVEYIRNLGVEINTNYVIGKTEGLDELFARGYKSVFLGTGAGLPTFMNIPGENLNGVFSANEFLTRCNLMKAYEFPNADTPIFKGKKVAVIGAGNTAMDAVRTGKRLGATSSAIVYRRSNKEMPARIEEIKHAEEEGIEFNLLVAPKQINGDEKGWVKSMDCIRMELGEPDASGRRRPVPIKGSEFTMEVDTVVLALGNGPNPLIPMSNPEIKVGKWGNIEVDPKTGMTSMKGVFAGGDIVRGGSTVILAMGDGKVASKGIVEYIK